MNLADDNQKISSLNIFTFIKEIYQSIKNFHKKLDSMTTQQKEFRQYIDRINKEHDLHIKRMQETIDNLALKLDNREAINNKLKNQLENKLSNLMVETVDNNDRLNLNINELTIGNLVDNNYNISDINDQLSSSSIMNNDNKSLLNDNMFVDNNNLSDTDENNYCINGIQNKSTDIIKNDINSLINSINFDNSDNSDIDNNVNIDDNIDVNDDVDKNNNENSDFNDDNQLDYQTIKKTDIKDLIFN